MDSSLFHLDPNGLLSPVVSQGFSSHGELQGLIADHPGLIGDGGGWFSITREGSAGASGWSSEHLFLSRDGVPAIVETSLAADTGAGGELVGRILYGAASAASWWPAGAVREAFAATADADPDVALGELIGTSRAASAYWAEVSTADSSARSSSSTSRRG